MRFHQKKVLRVARDLYAIAQEMHRKGMTKVAKMILRQSKDLETVAGLEYKFDDYVNDKNQGFEKTGQQLLKQVKIAVRTALRDLFNGSGYQVSLQDVRVDMYKHTFGFFVSQNGNQISLEDAQGIANCFGEDNVEGIDDTNPNLKGKTLITINFGTILTMDNVSGMAKINLEKSSLNHQTDFGKAATASIHQKYRDLRKEAGLNKFRTRFIY